MNRQPQTRLELIKSANIHPSTFSRLKRLLLNEKIIKETKNGFCLWNYEPESLWSRLVTKLQGAGGYLIDLTIQKVEIGKPDPITGWFEKTYNTEIPIQGIIILRGAKELEAAASLKVPDEFAGLLLTQGDVDLCDRLLWRGNLYEIQEIEEVFDGYEPSYKIAKFFFLPP